MPDMIRLLYVDRLGRYIYGVPACDFDCNVEEAYDLVASGLYEPEPEPLPEVVDEIDEEGQN